MRLFFSIFEKKKDEEENEKKKKRPKQARKHRVAGALMLMILLTSLYAEPVAAFSMPKPQWGWWDELKSNVLGGSVGALAGAKVGASIGAMVGGPVGALAGAGIGALAGYIAGAHIEQGIKEKIRGYVSSDFLRNLFGLNPHNPKIPTNFQQTKNVTPEEFKNNTAVIHALAANLTKEADQAAIQDLMILQAKVKSDLMEYSYEEAEGTGDFARAELYGPESIYGFSAFPVKFILVPRGSDEVKDPICLTSVRIYVKDTVNGDIKWTRSWSYEPGANCIDPGDEGLQTLWSFKTILKGPDDNLGDLLSVMNGGADNATISKLFSAKPDKFEIVVEVNGYRKIYYFADGEWHFDHDEPIHARWQSLSAWKHIGGGTYPLGGFGGSLPVDAKDTSEAMSFTRYNILFAGAASNLLTVTYGNPINILNATTNFKFVFQGNPGYFDPLSPTIVDEARVVVYRVLTDGTWELAASQPVDGPAVLGDIASGKKLYISITYHDAPNVATYRAFLTLKADVVRDDGTKIPIWILIEPNIAVLSPIRAVSIDPYVTEIGDIVADHVITAEELTKIRTMSDTLITSIQTKIKDAEVWKAKGEVAGKQDVVNYASLAIEHYNKAINYAEKMKSVEKSDDLLRYAEIVKEEEMIGDYYLEAARAAYYGQEQQAKALVENAEKLIDNVKQYEGGFFGVLPDFSDWKSVLWFVLKIAIAIAGIYIAKKLFGSVGALIAAGLAFVFLVGPMFGIYL